MTSKKPVPHPLYAATLTPYFGLPLKGVTETGAVLVFLKAATGRQPNRPVLIAAIDAGMSLTSPALYHLRELRTRGWCRLLTRAEHDQLLREGPPKQQKMIWSAEA